ncbi:kelch protein, putative [Plasmodium ovale]|uniref:Kelch protein, putative n=1 Tax=Plasmodium ovale TaxID=36330 RepID=A0A1C3KPW2_PLAOA|nr:kelch protein, putative [Plasmodium ovale]
MGKKDKKSKEKKEKVKQKKEKQKLKSLKSKKKKKNNNNNNALSDEDFDTICLYYENLNKKIKYGHININTTSNNTFVECEKPSPRSNCSITFINDEEFLLFGGEYNDNNELIAYNDLFKYNVIKDKWKYYFTTGKKPKPRCSHQAVYFNKKLYIFGGELCTNTQFFHYNDFWSFDLRNNIFEELETKNKKEEKPSPRSGHRMILWKSCIVMFGGFFDNGKSVEYFNDLYIYIINCNRWVNLTHVYVDSLFRRMTESGQSSVPNGVSNSTTKMQSGSSNHTPSTGVSEKKGRDKNSQLMKSKFLKSFDLDSYMPSKRSSICLFTDVNFQKIYIYGGYAQVKNTSRNAIGVYYNDLWILNINYINENNISVNFKKLKKSIFQPSKRVGFSTCVYKNSLFLFGGVFDKVEKNDSKKITGKGNIMGGNMNNNCNHLEESLNIQSIFFNDLYLFDMNKEHWSYLNLKNKEDKILNKNCKENNKKEEADGKPDDIHSKSGSGSKHLLTEQDRREGLFTQNKKSKFEANDLSDGYDSSNPSDGNPEDEYYSNVFVYFDENGNKKTIKIEKEEDTLKEMCNAKKECDDIFKNDTPDHSVANQEEHTVIDKIIDSQYVFVKTDEKTHSQWCTNVDALKGNTSICNYIKCAEDARELCPSCGDEKEEDSSKGKQTSGAVNVVESVESVEAVNDVNDMNSSDGESSEENKKMKFVISDVEPIGRINSHIFVLNKNLYLYGGMYEYKNNEIMLSDYWKINIFKREKWELLHKGNLNDIYVEESDCSSAPSIDDVNKDDREIEDLIICNKIKKIENKIKEENFGIDFNVNENLNEFFLRTKHIWLKELNIMIENKQNRKDAFILCEKKYITLKKYYNKIQKYKELLLETEGEGSVTEEDSSQQEQSSD